MNAQASYLRDFFVAGGTLRYDAPSYVMRPADGELYHLVQTGNLCYVLTTRQMGKSSLMNRLGRQLQAEGIATALIDLTTIGTASLEEWYLSLLDDLQVQLGLATEAEAWWEDQKALSPVKRFTKFFRDVVLAEIEGQTAVFIDEVDSALKLGFSDDFFAAIRAIYNQTLSSEAAGRLSFVLLGVATPNELIKSQHRTPFNVGERIELEELDLANARTVFAQGLPAQEPPVVDRVYDWTSGHPYLTQRVCQAIARDNRPHWTVAEIDELVAKLFFTERALVEESNLQFVNGRVLSSPCKEQLLQLYQQIHKGKKPVKNDERDPVQTELKLYGLVKGEPDGHLAVRNHIYRRVFDQDWIRQHQTTTWKRTAWITLVLVTILSIGLSIYLWRQAQRSQELLAETYISNFAATENPTLRLDNLAQLIALDGYTGEAITLFAELPTAEKVTLFTNPAADLQPQVESVIETMYVTQAVDMITADAESTPVLEAMLAALSQFDRLENPTIVPEIDSWLQGRTAVGQNDLQAAQLAYSVALSLNENNPATRYERALVALALPDDEAALADLTALLTYGEAWQNRVQETIAQHPQLHALITIDGSPFAELIAFVPTPTVPAILSTATELAVSPSPEQNVAEATAVARTLTPQPTLSPTDAPAPTPISGVSAPLLSSQGQLAFIHDQVLYVETEIRAGEFAEIGQYMSGIWSPDGSKMLLSIRRDQPLSVEIVDFQIWFLDQAETLSFRNTIEFFPDTIFPYTRYWWMEDGNKIVFIDLISGSEQPEQTSSFNSTLSLVDLGQNEFKIIAPVKFGAELISITPDSFTIMSSCGSPCTKLISYDYEGNTFWGSWETFGSMAINSNSQFAIDIGRSTIEAPNGVIDEINLISGDVKTIWQTSEIENLLPPLPSPPPHISPDGNFIAFHLLRDYDAQTFRGVPHLMIIDRDGRSYGTRENSQLLDWRPGGGPVVVQALDDGQNQLVYWSLTGAAAARVFVRPRDFRFVSGKWSENGRYFIYNALDDSIGASYLYLWQPESGTPQLIHSTASPNPFDNFTWMPDGSRVYFNLGNQALWGYDVVTAELTLIAPTREAVTR